MVRTIETTDREMTHMKQGLKLMEESRGNPAEKEIRDYLQKYGFIVDPNVEPSRAEEERHRSYNYFKNVTPFLERYRSYKRMLVLFRTELGRRVDAEVIGSVGDTNPDAEEGFFGRLCRKLDLLGAYDERSARAKYESQIMSCHYIETAVQALEFGMKMYQTTDPEGYTLLNMVYIQGELRPTVQQVMDELDISGTSTYYRRLDNAKRKLAQIMFGVSMSKDELLEILIFLKQQSEDMDFPIVG